jgi:hypothetical protein
LKHVVRSFVKLVSMGLVTETEAFLLMEVSAHGILC